MPPDPALLRAVSSVPPGPWAVGVSGGADSIALLLLLNQRPDLSLTVVHLNHETRGGASDADAAFVADLAASIGLASVVTPWRDVEPALADPPKNRSARFRAGRMALFRDVAQNHRL